MCCVDDGIKLKQNHQKNKNEQNKRHFLNFEFLSLQGKIPIEIEETRL